MNYISAPEVAAQYGIPLRTVQAACNTGAIKANKLGRMWVIDPDQAHVYATKWTRHQPRNGGA